MKRLLAHLLIAASVSACAAQLRPLPVKLDAANPDAPESAPLPASTALADEPTSKGGAGAPAEREGADGRRDAAAAGEGSTSEATVYTCPMHPEVERSEPGRCPKCGMDLVPKNPSTPGAEPIEGGAQGHGEHEGHGGGAQP